MLDSFVEEQSLGGETESVAFEHFANYCILVSEFVDTLELEEVWAGGGNDTGLDGIAIIVNGALVTSPEQVDDLAEQNSYVEATFVFTQAKSSSNFSTADFGTFGHGVRDFFSQNPQLVRNDAVKHAASIMDRVISKASLMRRGKPLCRLYYITTGTWQDDKNFTARIAALHEDLAGLQLFHEITISPIDADRIQKLFSATRNKATAEVTFVNRITLPDMDGVEEAYLGVLPVTEYLKLLADPAADVIRRTLFYDNVRDFQGDNGVNKEIEHTIAGKHQNHLAILNNGITIVAKELRLVGNKMTLEDYQIVNGCQTSHVLFNNRSQIDARTFVPVRIVSTPDDDLTNAVIKATNRQTPVSDDDLLALSDFQKKLETYYIAVTEPGRLYYERRSRQYNGVPGIEKVRIVSIPVQLRCIASMFLDEPHRASRYYGTLLKQIGEKIFKQNHDPLPYHLSAYANFKIEALFRNKTLDTRYRPIRYHMLMALRYHLAPGKIPLFSKHRKLQEFCKPLQDIFADEDQMCEACNHVASVIEKMGLDITDRDIVKTQSFTEQVRAAFGS